MVIEIAERLWGQVEPYLAAEEVELDDLELVGSGPGRVLRVVVDAAAGVSVDRIAQLSRGIQRLIEAGSLIDGTYTLEVTSPGLERRLRRPAQFRKSIGREVKLKTAAPVGDAQHYRGILREVAEGEIGVEVDGRVQRIPLAAITSAQTIFTLERAPKPGKRS